MPETKEFFLHLSVQEFQRALAIYLDGDTEEAMHFIKAKIVDTFLVHACKRSPGLTLGDAACRVRKCRTSCCRTGNNRKL
jgi:hypothetical protein